MAEIEGANEIIAKMGKVKASKAKQFERGALIAGLSLQRASQREVPVDTGALKNSAFTRKKGKGLDAEIIVGYTQNYAIYVHENLSANHPVGNAKYLEGPLKRDRQKLLNIIANEMKKDR